MTLVPVASRMYTDTNKQRREETMDTFACEENDHDGIVEIEITEEEIVEGILTYGGTCPDHGPVSTSINLHDLD